MKIAVGSDDLYDIAKFIVEKLREKGIKIIEVGALREGKYYPWPKVGFEVGELVAKGEADYGIVICYTGTGVCIATNKVKGVRAALCSDPRTAKYSRMWNDANVLALSARLVTKILVEEILEEWLKVKEADPSEEENIKMIYEYEIKASSKQS
ncbi:MAG TPA: RpiB/LacA/LacB family sugar-phosphate isomerase [Candidatus Atribacteria bacterium]|nr:RpiB/LacA/LacB family sugar-phosphate isomerase [Candidatus Atribacteria bacterium]